MNFKKHVKAHCPYAQNLVTLHAHWTKFKNYLKQEKQAVEEIRRVLDDIIDFHRQENQDILVADYRDLYEMILKQWFLIVSEQYKIGEDEEGGVKFCHPEDIAIWKRTYERFRDRLRRSYESFLSSYCKSLSIESCKGVCEPKRVGFFVKRTKCRMK